MTALNKKALDLYDFILLLCCLLEVVVWRLVGKFVVQTSAFLVYYFWPIIRGALLLFIGCLLEKQCHRKRNGKFEFSLASCLLALIPLSTLPIIAYNLLPEVLFPLADSLGLEIMGEYLFSCFFTTILSCIIVFYAYVFLWKISIKQKNLNFLFPSKLKLIGSIVGATMLSAVFSLLYLLVSTYEWTLNDIQFLMPENPASIERLLWHWAMDKPQGYYEMLKLSRDIIFYVIIYFIPISLGMHTSVVKQEESQETLLKK